mmetsp:Transcript_51392/g.143691  ORF Transcript_51392/g.143691 Transcript_51392/m.143691 type:complete len:140 (-) Transcript_51392:2-421(-)
MAVVEGRRNFSAAAFLRGQPVRRRRGFLALAAVLITGHQMAATFLDTTPGSARCSPPHGAVACGGLPAQSQATTQPPALGSAIATSSGAIMMLAQSAPVLAAQEKAEVSPFEMAYAVVCLIIVTIFFVVERINDAADKK